ncbi:MAG: hypothetical protein ACI8TP_001122 [Acidimicrobiales bacterium]|jgi:hypothetical protein
MRVPGVFVARLLTVLLAAAGCSTDSSSAASDTAAGEISVADTAPRDGALEQRHPVVIDAVFAATSSGTYDVAVTLSSLYDSPQRYADAWRVTSVDGNEVYEVRELSHDHASEQPFTRSLPDVAIPMEVTAVLVQGRDLRFGWGETKEFTLGES